MKSEDGWWVLKGTVRPRPRSSKKGSLEERKDDARTFTGRYIKLSVGRNLTSEPTSALYGRGFAENLTEM